MPCRDKLFALNAWRPLICLHTPRFPIVFIGSKFSLFRNCFPMTCNCRITDDSKTLWNLDVMPANVRAGEEQLIRLAFRDGRKACEMPSHEGVDCRMERFSSNKNQCSSPWHTNKFDAPLYFQCRISTFARLNRPTLYSIELTQRIISSESFLV